MRPKGLPNPQTLPRLKPTCELPPMALSTTAPTAVHRPMRVPNAAHGLSFTAILAVVCGTGCSALQIPAKTYARPSNPMYTTGGTSELLDPSQSEEEYHRIRQARSQNAIVLQIVGDSSPSRVLPLPSDGRSVYVTTLLKQTGVQEKLGGKIQATLYRHSKDSITGIPMEVVMSKDGQRVRPETDYTLRAGDRLRVGEAPSEILPAVFSTFLGI